MNEVGYIVSDGYDVAQTAICFLYQFAGRKVSEIYGKDPQRQGDHDKTCLLSGSKPFY